MRSDDVSILLKAINQAQQKFISGNFTANSVFDSLLQTLLDLTQSEYGFIGKVLFTADNQPYLKNFATTNIAWNDETRKLYREQSAQGMEFWNLRSLFGSALLTRAPVIANHPATDPRRSGLPAGHPPLDAFLGVPIAVDDALLGMFGIANRPGGYSPEIIEFLAPFTTTCAVIMQGLADMEWKQHAFNENERLLRHTQSLNEQLRLRGEEIRQANRELATYTAQLQKSENALKDAQRIARIGNLEWHLATNRLTFSDEFYRIYETDSHALGHSLDALLAFTHPEDEFRLIETARKALQGETNVDVEYRVVTPRGREKWIWGVIEGSDYDSHGRITRIVGTIQDITERKVIEQQLSDSEKWYKNLFEYNPLPMWICDLDTLCFLAVNNAAINQYGYTRDEFLSMTIKDIRPADDVDRLLHDVEINRKKFSNTGNRRHRRKDGTRIDVEITSHQIDFFGRRSFLVLANDVTERKATEQKLNFQASVLQNVKDVVITADLNGRITYFNRGAEKLFGYTADEMLGKSPAALHALEDHARVTDELQQMENGSVYDYVWEGQHKDGSKVWLSITASLMRNAAKESTGFICVGKDISDWKLAEEKRRESESHLRSIFDSTIQSYFLLDRNYKIIAFNRIAEITVQINFSRMIRVGDSILELIDPDVLDDLQKNVQRAFNGEKILNTREVKLPNKKRGWFDVQYLPAYNERNEINAVAFATLDVTQRKRTEIALLKSYQDVRNFRNALYASALISITDLSGRITEVNQPFCEVSGYSRQELIGANHRIIGSGYHEPAFFREMWRTIAKGNCWRGEILNKTKAGALYWVDTNINPIFNESGQITQYLSVRHVITERKKAEQEREALIADLTKFAYVTAHQLRGPLARILGLVSLFDHANPANAFNETIIEKLGVSATELDDIVHRMIDLLNRTSDE